LPIPRTLQPIEALETHGNKAKKEKQTNEHKMQNEKRKEKCP